MPLRATDQQIRSLIPGAIKTARIDALLESPWLVNEDLTSADEERVAKIVRKELKDKHTQDEQVRIIRNVLTQLFKALYTRRAFWRDGLNANSD